MPSQNVSDSEIKQYLQDKLNKLQHQVEVTQAALNLLEEATMEIAIKKTTDSYVDEVFDSIKLTEAFDSSRQVFDGIVGNIKETSETQGEIKSGIESFSFNGKTHIVGDEENSVVSKQAMTVDGFLLKLRSLRTSLGLSLKKVGEGTKMEQSNVSLIELGRSKGTKNSITALSEFYDIFLTDLNIKYKDGCHCKYIKPIPEPQIGEEIKEIVPFVFGDRMTVEYFYDNLRNIRQHLGIRLDKVVKDNVISRSFLYRMEAKDFRNHKATKMTALSLSNYYGIHLIDIDKKFHPITGRYINQKQQHAIVGTVKQIKTSTGLIKHVYTRKDNSVLTGTNGQKIKKKYKKREPKQNAIAEFEALPEIPKSIVLRETDAEYSLRWWINKCYKRIVKTVRGTAFKSGWNFDDIMSEMHEKLIKALINEARGDLDFRNDEERFMGWIYAMSRNVTVDESRLKHNRIINRAEEALGYADNNKHNQTVQPNIDIKDFTEELKAYVDKMLMYKPRSYRICFEKFFYEGKKYEEIARIASIPLNAVKSAIHTMRDLIKAEFGNKYKYLLKED